MKSAWLARGVVLVLGFSGVARAELAPTQEQACVDKMITKIEIAVLNSNLANVNTTRTPQGGPYLYKRLACVGDTCRVISEASVRSEYEPNHPDADERGFVSYPKFDVNRERESLSLKTREYEIAERDCPTEKPQP